MPLEEHDNPTKHKRPYLSVDEPVWEKDYGSTSTGSGLEVLALCFLFLVLFLGLAKRLDKPSPPPPSSTLDESLDAPANE